MSFTPGIERVPVLVIGAGAAGLRAAIELRERGVECLVLGKRAHGDAHTVWAAGGVNASLGSRDPDDHWHFHLADTLREGHFVCDPLAVETLCRDAPARVLELRDWGCPFNRLDDGQLDQRYFGAQSRRRTCFAGDRTGEAILSTLTSRADPAGVAWRENVFISEIVVHAGRACGAVGVDLVSGDVVAFHSQVVLLAAGGATSAYRRSSSRPDENNGDSVALAWAAGAVLRDMEFVQFHPTGMVQPPSMVGRLVTEAARGEGGRLFNIDGERFMERYSPERLELDARDVVARAIAAEIRDGRGTERGAVLLDVSHLNASLLRERLPKLCAQLAEHGVDLLAEPVEVAPTAHYAMGGVRVDFATCRTDVPGLYAAGEATAGVHGANRLGGNSLAETVVFGRVAGAITAREVLAGTGLGRGVAGRSGASPASTASAAAKASEAAVRDAASAVARAVGHGLTPRSRGAGVPDDVVAMLEEAGELLWEHAGIIRSAEGLRRGLERLARLRDRAAQASAAAAPCAAAFQRRHELQFTLLAGEANLRSGLCRKESRGAHFREDAPESAEEWRRSVLCVRDGEGRMTVRTEPVAALGDELERVVVGAPEPGYHQLE